MSINVPSGALLIGNNGFNVKAYGATTIIPYWAFLRNDNGYVVDATFFAVLDWNQSDPNPSCWDAWPQPLFAGPGRTTPITHTSKIVGIGAGRHQWSVWVGVSQPNVYFIEGFWLGENRYA